MSLASSPATMEQNGNGWWSIPYVVGTILTLGITDWGVLLGPLVTLLGTVAGAWFKYKLDQRRLQYLERIQILEKENKKLRDTLDPSGEN